LSPAPFSPEPEGLFRRYGFETNVRQDIKGNRTRAEEGHAIGLVGPLVLKIEQKRDGRDAEGIHIPERVSWRPGKAAARVAIALELLLRFNASR
jgi:hypothetical protein